VALEVASALVQPGVMGQMDRAAAGVVAQKRGLSVVLRAAMVGTVMNGILLTALAAAGVAAAERAAQTQAGVVMAVCTVAAAAAWAGLRAPLP